MNFESGKNSMEAKKGKRHMSHIGISFFLGSDKTEKIFECIQDCYFVKCVFTGLNKLSPFNKQKYVLGCNTVKNTIYK